MPARHSLPATHALTMATKSIPIVMAGVGNQVELGIVADFREPGGNITGSSYLANEYAGKLLQLLKQGRLGCGASPCLSSCFPRNR